MRKMLILLWLACIHSSYALDRIMYFDTCAGIGQQRKSEGLFGTSVVPELGMGASVNSAIMVDSSVLRFLQLHYGIQYRYSTGSSNTTNRSVQALYPMIRLESSQGIFTGAGVSPLTYKREKTSAGLDGFSRASSALGVLIEFGFENIVTPQVSWLLLGDLQGFYQNKAFGPLILEGMVGLRFNFGAPSNFGVEKKYWGEGINPDEYDGWRYPYGKEKTR